jgi:uncharacterized protein
MTEPRFIEEVRRIVLDSLKGYPARVLFFGSRAWGTEHRYSDVDVAVDSDVPIPAGAWLDLKERLESSWVPYDVDLVNLRQAPESLRERAFSRGIVWRG